MNMIGVLLEISGKMCFWVLEVDTWEGGYNRDRESSEEGEEENAMPESDYLVSLEWR